MPRWLTQSAAEAGLAAEDLAAEDLAAEEDLAADLAVDLEWDLESDCLARTDSRREKLDLLRNLPVAEPR